VGVTAVGIIHGDILKDITSFVEVILLLFSQEFLYDLKKKKKKKNNGECRKI
jgi:hypothetical protein